MNKRTIIFAVGILLGLQQIHAETWSLRRCVNYAIENNISIKQRENVRRQQELQLSNAKNSRLPNLDASASQNFSFGRGLTSDNTYTNKSTSSTSFSLGTSVPLFTGLRIPNTIKLNQLNLEASTADLEKAKNDISVQVAQAYVQILYNLEIADVARRQISIDSMQVVRLQAMIDNGKASEAELAQQRATLAQSRLTATQAQNQYNLAVLTLTQLLELPSTDGFTVERPNVGNIANSSEKYSVEAIYAEAIDVKPEVRAEELRLKGADYNINIARSGWYPQLSLSAGLGTNYYKTSGFKGESFSDQIKNNFSQYIGLNLSVPIFNRFQTRNSVRSAKIERETQQLQLDNVKKSLYKEIQQACQAANAASAKYASSIEAGNSSNAAYRLMQAKYENGKANITEFNEAKNNLMKAESDLVQAKYEYVFQTTLVDFYRGKAIDF
ncbi:MAG: TolC family protein [Prevotella sp.]|nr:TolC family protein [Prevotella sp.]